MPRMAAMSLNSGSRQPFVAWHWPTLVGAWLHLTVSFMVVVVARRPGRGDWGCVASDRGQQGVLVALPLLSRNHPAWLRAGLAIGRRQRTGLLVLGWSWSCDTWLRSAGRVLWNCSALRCFWGRRGNFAVAMPVAGRAYPPAHQGLASAWWHPGISGPC